MTKRPAFWIALTALSLAAVAAGVRYFPDAFSIVSLDISMARGRALADARAIMERDRRGPAGYRQTASFGGDEEAQTDSVTTKDDERRTAKRLAAFGQGRESLPPEKHI